MKRDRFARIAAEAQKPVPHAVISGSAKSKVSKCADEARRALTAAGELGFVEFEHDAELWRAPIRRHGLRARLRQGVEEFPIILGRAPAISAVRTFQRDPRIIIRASGDTRSLQFAHTIQTALISSRPTTILRSTVIAAFYSAYFAGRSCARSHEPNP
jgi:hypothetical protein